MLNMVNLSVNINELYRWGSRFMLGDDIDYLLHAYIRKIFGALGPQPYFFDRKMQRILGYTQHSAADISNAFQESMKSCNYHAITLSTTFLRPMPDNWTLNSSFYFTLRCRPITRWNEECRAEGNADSEIRGTMVRESDVWLRRVYLEWYKSGKEIPLNVFRSLRTGERFPCYIDWLHKHVCSAAEIVSAGVTSFREGHITTRNNRDHSGAPRKSKSRGYSDVTIQGILSIKDPSEFNNFLARGIGRHKAFGFGMLLLRRMR